MSPSSPLTATKELSSPVKHETTDAAGGEGVGYSVVYIDPPWFYNQRANTDSFRGGACRQYPLMKDYELIDFGPRVDKWAAPSCAMAMWATGARLDFAFELLSEWRWRYRTMLAVWVKTYDDGRIVTGLGHYTSQSCEYLLLAGRGSIPVDERLLQQVHYAVPTEGHSVKPMVFRKLVECLWPTAKRIEVFARTAHPGWDAWGNDVGIVHGGEKVVEPWRKRDDEKQGRLFA